MLFPLRRNESYANLHAPTPWLTTLCLSSLSFLILSGTEVEASTIKDEKNLSWHLQENISSHNINAEENLLRSKHMMPTDVDINIDATETLNYSVISRENTDQRAWLLDKGIRDAELMSHIETMRGMGYRPVDQESYQLNDQVEWVILWVENLEDVQWHVQTHVIRENFNIAYYGMIFQGFRMVDIEIDQSQDNTLNGYHFIWQENVDGRQWFAMQDLDRENQNLDSDMDNSTDDYITVDYEAYTDSNQTPFYAAIYEQKPDFEDKIITDQTPEEFLHKQYIYADSGLRLIDIEKYDDGSDTQYAAVWVENDARFNYNKKEALDIAINEYKAINNLPGIVVSITHKGEKVYQKGFGYANVENQTPIHSRTVFNAASLSKLVGGVLAAKIDYRQHLQDGSALQIPFNLFNSTQVYIPNLPEHHQHLVTHLFSHTSCIGHYPEYGDIEKKKPHYTTAIEAIEHLKDESLWNLENCKPPSQYLGYYSTHAFTFAAAVLEGSTGRSINELLRQEIFEPYEFSSMRVQFETPELPENPLRTAAYRTKLPVTRNCQALVNEANDETNPNLTRSYPDSSWKILGGGLESNIHDMAKLATGLMTAEILPEETRDQKLWKDRTGSSFGLAWKLSYDNNDRRTAEWTGNSSAGARHLLRAYRDDDLVITIMSNRNSHRCDIDAGIIDLGNTLGNIVLETEQ